MEKKHETELIDKGFTSSKSWQNVHVFYIFDKNYFP